MGVNWLESYSGVLWTYAGIHILHLYKVIAIIFTQLAERRVSMKRNAESLLNQVRTLWDRLATETEHREQFLHENQGYKNNTIQAVSGLGKETLTWNVGLFKVVLHYFYIMSVRWGLFQ